MSAPRASSASTRPRQASGSPMRSIVATLVILAAGVVIFLAVRPFPPRFDLGPHTALGEILAGEAKKLCEPGSRIIVIVRDTQEEFKAPASEAQFAGFQQALKKAGGKITTAHRFKIDPLRVVGVASGDFLEVLRRCADNDVVVSFLGPPTLSEDQLVKLGNKRPKILAVCSGAMPQLIDLRKLFDQKLLNAAVISRSDVSRTDSGAGSGPAAFDRMFKLITPGNIADLQQPPAATSP